MKCIAYNDGYKYQTKVDFHLSIDIKLTAVIDTDYIVMDEKGQLTVKKGYAWDGPSGPVFVTKSFIRGSLVHDALYQLMREGRLDRHAWRESADKLLWAICIEDGMWRVYAWFVLQGVRLFADIAADPADNRPVEYAPTGCQM